MQASQLFPVGPLNGRFPLVPRDGEVRYGKAKRPYVQWNVNEENALASVVEYWFRAGNAYDTIKIYDCLFNAYPDWQRSELSVKAAISKTVDKVKRILSDETTSADRRKSLGELNDLHSRWMAYHSAALLSSQQAGAAIAEELKEELLRAKNVMMQAQKDYEAQLKENELLKDNHDKLETQVDELQHTVDTMNERKDKVAAVMKMASMLAEDPSIMDQVSMESLKTGMSRMAVGAGGSYPFLLPAPPIGELAETIPDTQKELSIPEIPITKLSADESI